MSEAELSWARPRQYDLELSEQPGLRVDVDAAAVLFDVPNRGSGEGRKFKLCGSAKHGTKRFCRH
jgi:hypothetical protein